MTAKLHAPWPTFAGLQNTNLNNEHDDKNNTNDNHLTTKEELEKQICKYAIIQKDDEQLGDGQFSVVKACCNIKTKKKYAMKLIHKKLILDKLRLIQREVGILRLLRDEVKECEINASGKEATTDEKNNDTNNENQNQIENQSSTSICSTTSDSSVEEDCETEYLFKGHHHVLQLFDFFETKQHIVLITQLCDRGDLYDYIISNGSLNLNKTVRPYTACILSGLKFLHDNGIVHRDIKAENILFRMHYGNIVHNTTVKGKDNKKECPYDLKSHDLIIADFGLATFVENTSDMREYVGTLSYISPEIVACQHTKTMEYSDLIKIPSYDYKVDIWALGVLCYFMKFGYMPFDCETEQESLDCIKDGDYYLEEDEEEKLKKEHESHVEKEFLNFLQHCFTVDQHQRPSSTSLLSHPFVNKFFHDTVDLDETALQEIRPVLSTIQRSKSTASIYMKRPPSRTSSQNSLKSLSNHSASHVFLKNSSLTSLTSLAKDNLVAPNPSHHNHNYSSQPDNDNKNLHYSQLNSTFKLEPEISENYLMVGSYCESPSVFSSYTNSPMLSRGNSAANITMSSSSGNNNNNTTSSNSSNSKTAPLASSNLRMSAMSNNTGSTSNTSVSLMSFPNSQSNMGKYSSSNLKNNVPRSITPLKEEPNTAQNKETSNENAHPVFYL